jgi:hypothetical protein
MPAGLKYESIQKIDSKEAVMTLMTGFPLVTYLMEIRLGGRFHHLPPSVAAELEAFEAEQKAAAKPDSAPPATDDGTPPAALRPVPGLRLREAC